MKTGMNQQIGLRIRRIRVEKGLTQSFLDTHCNLEPGTFQRIENNETMPAVETLLRIRRIFGVSLDWLLTGEGLKYPLDIEDSLEEVFLLLMESTPTARFRFLSFFWKFVATNSALFERTGGRLSRDDIENTGTG